MATVGGSVGSIGCLIFALTLSVAAAGDYVVVRAPKFVQFLPTSDPIETTEISPLIAAMFGLPMNRDLKWNGLEEGSVFRRPKASAVISVTGVPDERLDIPHVASYKTNENENDLSTADLAAHIESFDWKAEPLFVDFAADANLFDIRCGFPDVFANLPSTLGALSEDVAAGAMPRWFTASQLGSLNASNDADLRFLGELYVAQEIVHLLQENQETLKTKSPDFFHFHISGLELLAQTHGIKSAQFSDALRLLRRTVEYVSDGLEAVYSENVVVQLVTFSPEASLKPIASRHVRSLQSTPVLITYGMLNLAPFFSQSYSAIFNICLWTMIAFGLTMFFVSWGIWNMDPGRDSIIYRMTSTRMKRD